MKYPLAISVGDGDVGKTTIIKHRIETAHENPVYVPVRRLQGPILQEVEKSCKELEKEGVIRRSYSPYSAPIVPVRKPDGKIRLCIDYRELNKITKRDSFPLPNLIDTLFNLHGIIFHHHRSDQGVLPGGDGGGKYRKDSLHDPSISLGIS